MIRVTLTKEEAEQAADFLASALMQPSEDKTNEESALAESAMKKIQAAMRPAPQVERILIHTCKCSGKVSGKLRAGAKTTTGTCEKCGDQYRLHAVQQEGA
jgi:hypothetical protein